MNLQALINSYRKKWIADGQWVDPDVKDALCFAVTEIGEALDAMLRLQHFVRNNPIQEGHGMLVPTRGIAVECFDAIMMLTIAVDLLGEDVETVGKLKLGLMDTKRRAWKEVKEELDGQ